MGLEARDPCRLKRWVLTRSTPEYRAALDPSRIANAIRNRIGRKRLPGIIRQDAIGCIVVCCIV